LIQNLLLIGQGVFSRRTLENRPFPLKGSIAFSTLSCANALACDTVARSAEIGFSELFYFFLPHLKLQSDAFDRRIVTKLQILCRCNLQVKQCEILIAVVNEQQISKSYCFNRAARSFNWLNFDRVFTGDSALVSCLLATGGSCKI
jgi:hypothetical protein